MEKITTELFRKYRIPGAVQWSPNAERAALVLQTVNGEEDTYNNNIWVMENEQFRQVTGFDKESSFIWDDDTTLLFPTLRQKSDQKKVEEGEELTVFYRLNLEGGEAVEAFRLPLRVSKIEKIKEGKYLILARCDANVPDYYQMSEEERRKVQEDRKKNADFPVLDEAPFWSNGTVGFVNKIRTRLFFYEEKENCLTAGSAPLVQVGSTAVIGDEIYYCGTEYSAKVPLPNDVWCFDTVSKTVRQVYKNDRFYNRAQSIAALDDQLIFMASTIEKWGQNTHPDFWIMDKQSGELQLMHEADYSFYDLKQRTGRLIFNGQCRISTNLFEVTPSKIQQLTEWDGQITSFDECCGKIILIGKQGTCLDEVYLVDETKTPRRISHFNDELLKDRYVGACEPITISSHDWEVDGWVIKPIDFDPNKRYPAILTIHGGPKGAYRGVYAHEMQQWASEGYFVLFCNPIGSDGRGNQFAEIRKLHGTVDYEDIMNFTDEVLRRYPQIDERRMGVTGVSYGGYMTNWIIGHTHRFAAASSQCSVVNWVSMYGVSDISMHFVPDQMDGSIFDSIETYWDHSPLKYACNVTTPTLFIQPLEDYRCHLSDGLQMITALIDRGVETRVCCFKGDHHGLNAMGKPSHRERSYQETLNWMNAHLKNN